MHASATLESCAVRHMPYCRLGMRKSTREKQIFGKPVWLHGFNGGVYKFCTSETHTRVVFALGPGFVKPQSSILPQTHSSSGMWSSPTHIDHYLLQCFLLSSQP